MTVTAYDETTHTYTISLDGLKRGTHILNLCPPMPERVQRDRDRTLRGKARRAARRAAA